MISIFITFDSPKVESLSHHASDSTSENRKGRIGLPFGLLSEGGDEHRRKGDDRRVEEVLAD